MMIGKKYSLVYSDGRHYHEYARLMTLEQAKAKVEQNVRRYFQGEPKIEYLDYAEDYEAFVHYQVKDDNGRRVAHINITLE